MRFAVLVVAPPGYIHSHAFDEVAELLHYGLLALGHDSIITKTLLPDRLPIVLGPNLLQHYPMPLPPGAILYNLEQISPESTWLDPALLGLFRQLRVWDYSLKNIQGWAQLGVQGVQHVPIGYVPELTRVTNLDPADQDIDVLFYGSLNPRRLEILEALQAAGVAVEVAFGVYGAERDRLIVRAKIVLNIHFYAAQLFEIVRVSYLLANQKLVISETSPGEPDQESLGTGIVFAEYDQLVATCLQYLALPRRRQQIAATGFNLMQQRRQEEYLRDVVRSLERRYP